MLAVLTFVMVSEDWSFSGTSTVPTSCGTAVLFTLKAKRAVDRLKSGTNPGNISAGGSYLGSRESGYLPIRLHGGQQRTKNRPLPPMRALPLHRERALGPLMKLESGSGAVPPAAFT